MIESLVSVLYLIEYLSPLELEEFWDLNVYYRNYLIPQINYYFYYQFLLSLQIFVELE